MTLWHKALQLQAKILFPSLLAVCQAHRRKLKAAKLTHRQDQKLDRFRSLSVGKGQDSGGDRAVKEWEKELGSIKYWKNKPGLSFYELEHQVSRSQGMTQDAVISYCKMNRKRRKGKRNQVWAQHSYFYTVQKREREIWCQIFVTWDSATLMTERYILWILTRHHRFAYYSNFQKLNEEWECEKKKQSKSQAPVCSMPGKK